VALSALLLSRSRLRTGTTAWATVGVTALAFAYGIVNCVRDAWNEQLVKRGLYWKIPEAILPSLSAVWLAIFAIAALTALALRGESRRIDSPA
jgi:TRAP-type C4-dicarboxylate transport system permease small subunit